MCNEALGIVSNIMYSLIAIALCVYISRIHKYFLPPDKRYVAVCVLNFSILVILLGFHIESDCSRVYINIGAILLALWFCLGVVELFLYISSKIYLQK